MKGKDLYITIIALFLNLFNSPFGSEVEIFELNELRKFLFF